jgi:hypothetical protein
MSRSIRLEDNARASRISSGLLKIDCQRVFFLWFLVDDVETGNFRCFCGVWFSSMRREGHVGPTLRQRKCHSQVSHAHPMVGASTATRTSKEYLAPDLTNMAGASGVNRDSVPTWNRVELPTSRPRKHFRCRRPTPIKAARKHEPTPRFSLLHLHPAPKRHMPFDLRRLGLGLRVVPGCPGIPFAVDV